MRINTGEQDQVRAPAGEQKPVRPRAGENPPVGKTAGPQPPAAEPLSVPVISGNQPAEPGKRTEPRAARTGDEHPDAGDEEIPQELETVDLSSRMAKQPEADDAGDSSPDTTAVLEMGPTADLSSRLDQEKAERRP